MRLRCLDEPVEVVRDGHGVPHVRARGLADLARATGFVQARDRLFQMELLRRFAAGRLAELAGPAALPVDRVARRLRLAWSAQRDADAAEGDARLWAEAYSEGVNAFLALRRLPLELRLLRVRPAPWTPVDVHAPAQAMAVGLAVNWQNELARMRMRRRVEPELVDELPPIVAAGGASNSWALAGSRTATGKPLLANDPHLLLDLPSIWYPQHLAYEGGSVAGFGIPGAGVVILGRAERVAWGFTAAGADTQDLYLERLREDGRYEADGDWLEPERLRETIRVRFRREPVLEEVLVTRHGPIVGRAGEHALALRWSAHEPAHTLRCFLALMRARTVDEADRAFDDFAGPPQNVVLADADGEIAYRLAGGPVPRRRPGQGLEPSPGWDSSAEWDGWIPSEELPRLRNPPGGAIVTANNRMAGPEYPHFLGADDLSPYRARRIEQLLGELGTATVDDCRRIQLDRRSLPGLELAAAACSFEPRGEAERRALELLEGWDGDLGPGSAAGALYAVLMRHLQREVYAPLGAEPPAEEAAWRAESQIGLGLFERLRPSLLRALATRDDSFLGDGRDWDTVFRRALALALDELGEGLGRRRWGDLHRFELAHPLSRLPFLRRRLGRGPFPMGGDADTVWQMSWLAARPYGPRLAGPSFRAVYDLADADGLWFALPGGVSGSPRSRHYADLLPAWLAGRLVRLRTRAVDGVHETLMPVSGSS